MKINIFITTMNKFTLVLWIAAIVMPVFSETAAPSLPPIDEEVPYFADDSAQQGPGNKGKPAFKSDVGRPAQAKPAVAPASAPAVVNTFTGSLYIHTDTGDTLPVFINGKLAGATPFRIDHCAVGRYVIGYLNPLLRDSLQNDKGTTARTAVPAPYQSLFKGRKVDVPVALKSLAEYSDQNVILKDNDAVEVVFSVRDMLAATEDTKKSYYGRIILGGGIITAIALIVLLSAN
jgi:hypothetical protein